MLVDARHHDCREVVLLDKGIGAGQRLSGSNDQE